DHDALTGAVRFTRACKAAGIRPVYGAELTLKHGGVPNHVTVLAQNRTGYANLCRLISSAHITHERGDPSLVFGDLAEHAEGLFVLSGCAESEVARLAAAGRIPDAISAARRYKNAFGDDFYLEVFDHRGYGHRCL